MVSPWESQKTKMYLLINKFIKKCWNLCRCLFFSSIFAVSVQLGRFPFTRGKGIPPLLDVTKTSVPIGRGFLYSRNVGFPLTFCPRSSLGRIGGGKCPQCRHRPQKKKTDRGYNTSANYPKQLSIYIKACAVEPSPQQSAQGTELKITMMCPLCWLHFYKRWNLASSMPPTTTHCNLPI